MESAFCDPLRRGICHARCVCHHNHVSIRVHVIFATKDRRPAIPDNLLTETWMYIGGICRNLKLKLYAVGGMRDHVHVFLALSAVDRMAEVVQKIKSNTSRFLHEKGVANFAWQEGYGAFSVSVSQSDATIEYIHSQAQHHAKRDVRAEWQSFLAAHGLADVVPGGTRK